VATFVDDDGAVTATVDEMAAAADAIANTASKRQKVRVLSGFLSQLSGDELAQAARYFAGTVFPPGDPRTLGVGGAAFGAAVRSLTTLDDDALGRIWRRHADVGDWLRTALVESRPDPGAAMSLADLDDAFAAMAAAPGGRARSERLTALLRRATPDAARIIAKLISGDMRIGLREGLVEEAVGFAFGAEPKAVNRAAMLVGDLGEVARLAAEGRLGEAEPRWFVPLRFMLATPVADATEAVKRLGDEVWVEDKYDGIRCQLHRRAGRVELYSRDLRNISTQFPEIVTAAARLDRDVMLDGEVLAYRDGRVMPFQALQTRLGRTAPDASVLASVPVVYVAWDLLRAGDEVLLDEPLRERRRRLEALPTPEHIALAHLESVVGEEEVNRRFDDARARLNEGLMLKAPLSAYSPGRRGMAWLKLKRPLDTLDVVVVGAEWGHGKRHGVLSDVTFAVRVDGSDELATIGKAYTGLSDAEIAEMTQLLLDITISEHGPYRRVRPEIVLEVAFDNVQESARHRSGFALRFPRIARWRHDKPVSEIDTLSRVRALSQARTIEKQQLVDRAP
jgi:DNA ligase-1